MAEYAINYKSLNSQRHGNPNRFAFGAASDGDAATIKTAVDAMMAARGAALMKYLYRNDAQYNTTHPEGTRRSASVVLTSATDFMTIHIRNLVPSGTGVTDADLAAAFVGHCNLPDGSACAVANVVPHVLPGT